MSTGYHKNRAMSITKKYFCKFFSFPQEAAYTDNAHAYIYGKEGNPMKIVVLRTPALIAPILRRMFGIRKEKKR